MKSYKKMTVLQWSPVVLYPFLAREFSCSLSGIWILNKVTVRQKMVWTHSLQQKQPGDTIGEFLFLDSWPPTWPAKPHLCLDLDLLYCLWVVQYSSNKYTFYLNSQSLLLLISTKLTWYSEDMMMITNNSWDCLEIFFIKTQVILKLLHSVIQITFLDLSSSNLNQVSMVICLKYKIPSTPNNSTKTRTMI